MGVVVNGKIRRRRLLPTTYMTMFIIQVEFVLIIQWGLEVFLEQ